ncbi:MAG: C40 family peptidase, partial [Chloroflexia bacterium]|nr:C40 family peptidase [Chloroflexia bacterium]
ALGSGAAAEAEIAYEPEGKEASYDAAQEAVAAEVEAAPVEPVAEVAAEVEPVAEVEPAAEAEVAPVESVPAEVAAPAPASEFAAYDPANVIATAWIVGTDGDGAVCRAGMDFASAEAGWLAEGSAVDVIGETVGEWQPVNCGGTAGFIHASFIAWEPPATVDAGDDDETTDPAMTDPVTVDADDDDVTTEPTTTDAVPVEASPRANRERGNGGGDDGVSDDVVDSSDDIDSSDDGAGNDGNDGNSGNDGGGGGSGQEMADFAMQYVGYPYVYAGEGPYAFDCSGFTMFVARNVLGMEITHDMFVQVGMGQSVSRGQLQAGDLVFFQNTFRDGLSHNGIYVGGGQFVHAENESTGVRVSDIDSDYYASRWYGATRLT